MYHDTPNEFLSSVWQGAYFHRHDVSCLSAEYGFPFISKGDHIIASLNDLGLYYIHTQSDVSLAEFKAQVISGPLPRHISYSPADHSVSFFVALG